jgi:polyferredoxin
LMASLGVALMGYFIPYAEMLALWQAGGNPATLMAVSLGLLTLISLFLLLAGHHFCRYACPYGMLQGTTAYLTGKFRPMEVRMRPDVSTNDCGGCHGCQSACPVDLDPRQFAPQNGAKLGFFDGCFNCGLCLDACHHIQAQKDTTQRGFLRFKMPFSAA